MIEGEEFEGRANRVFAGVAGAANYWKANHGAAYSTRIKAAVETIHVYLKEIEDLLREDGA